MTRIVQLANFYGPSSGGLRTTLEELGRRYTRTGHQRVLIVPGRHDADETGPAGRRITLRSPRLPGSGGYRVITNRPRVLSLLSDLAPDVVEVSDKTTLVAAASWARSEGVPAVLVSHERIDAILSGRVPSAYLLGRGADRWNRRLAGLFGAIVCPSRFSAEEFARVGAGHHLVVPLGVDLATFHPPRIRPSRTAEVELVCVGRLSAEKRPDVALSTLAELVRRGVDAHLTVAGDGPLRARLAEASRGLPVTWTGHVSDRAEVATLLARADVALAPCPVESFGLSVLEALACGTPVVTASTGAARELVDAGCGRAVRLDPGLMANAVLVLAGQDQYRRREAARSRAELFPWSVTVDGLLAAHRRAGAGGRIRPAPRPGLRASA